MINPVTRRGFLRRTSTVGVAAVAAGVLAPKPGGGPAASAQDPRRDTVFLDYTQDELDRAYDQFEWVDYSRNQVLDFYAVLSAKVRSEHDFTTHSYGAGKDETLDFFPASAPNAPIHVFVHGGSWRGLSKEDSSLGAPTFVENGAHYVALGFSNIPDARLPEMAAQVRRAIVWLYRNARGLGGDPERLYISGHSSGGHLAAVALTTDWGRHGVPRDVLKGGVCISGMYDLHPVVLSARSAFLELTKEEVHALSPQRHLGQVRCPIVAAYGSAESPEFVRQPQHFVAQLERRSRFPSELVRAKGLNHFDISFTLGYPDAVMGGVALRQMGLTDG